MRWSSRSGAMVIALSLTARALALSFDFTYIDDANSTFASRGWLDPGSLFQRNIRAAADLSAARFDSDATIVVDVDPHSYFTRAGGTNALGRYLYTNTAGKNVWEFGPLTRILTGSNPGETFHGYDILLGFDAAFVENQYWFDPRPELRTDVVPANKGDFMSVVLHELGHGFGFTGYRDFSTGQILGNTATQFDDRSYFGGDGNPIANNGSRNPMYFRGDYAAGLYGGDLHLTHKPPGHPNYSQNFFHLSTCDGDGLDGTLMNGCVLPNRAQLEITPLDSAVFADLGYPVVTPSADFNDNGSTDAADYVLSHNSFGQTGIGLAADGNLNNQVDQGDYTFWRSRFGQAAGSGSALPSAEPLSAAVPEPATLLMVIMTVAGCSFQRRCSAQRVPKTHQRVTLVNKLPI